ncbi:MAG: FAD:protein FMN transferase [Planctomycetota bacterium]
MTSAADRAIGSRRRAGTSATRFPARLVYAFPLLILAAACSRGGSPAASDPAPFELAGRTMGTTWSVKLPADREGRVEGLREELVAELEAVEDAMSTYRPESELCRFNRAPAGLVSASPELASVVANALEVGRASGGAFDVTVGPIVDLWGFGAGPGERRAPSAEDLEAARRLVGLDRLGAIRAGAVGGPSLEKATDGLRVDLSGIAKGHGVDRLAARLAARGEANWFINVGGEIRAAGRRSAAREWKVAVERPSEGRQLALAEYPLRDRAMATSGDYRNFFVENGRRFSHTIDPRTGRPIEHALAQVSVVATDCETADAWATALDVLGPVEGPRLAEERGLAALFLVRREDGGFDEVATTAFRRFAAGS